MQLTLGEQLTKKIEEEERDVLTGLEKAGFKLDRTPLWKKYLTKGGGYYIDIGCSKLIIDGKIKIHHSPNGIKGFGKKELMLADDTALPADIVVLATGYDNMRTTVRKVLGDEIADQLQDVWDLDSEGELNAVSPRHIYPLSLFCSSHDQLSLINLNRCGAHLASNTSGIWRETWRSADPIPNSWHCRLQPSKEASTSNRQIHRIRG